MSTSFDDIVAGLDVELDDGLLLVLAMILMAGADGRFDACELSSIAGLLDLLPEFKDRDTDALLDAGINLATEFEDAQVAVRLLSRIQNEATRIKCYLVAADIAMSTGRVHVNEDVLLNAMQKILGIDDALAFNIMEVLSLKYAT